MTRARISLTLGAFVLGLTAVSTIGYAQTGRIKGKVVDAQNKPVEGATILMESKEMNRKLTTKTDKRGEYTQFLPPGEYMVTASKDNLSQSFPVKVSIDEREQNFTLKPGGSGGARCSVGSRRQETGGRDRRHQGRVRPGRGVEQRKQVRRGDREVQRSPGQGTEVRRVPDQHRGRLHAEEGIRPGRGRLQEGARDSSELG